MVTTTSFFAEPGGRVEHVCLYRLKGARGENVLYLRILPGIGIEGDRQFAILQADDGQGNVWRRKNEFYVCMNTMMMAMEEPRYIVRRTDCGEEVIGIDPRYLEELARRLGISGPLIVQDTRRTFDLSDTRPGKYISFGNLATYEVWSEYVARKYPGKQLDKRRLRMSMWASGLKPFEEYSWVKKYPGNSIIEVGNDLYSAHDILTRCPAIKANPDTGAEDNWVFESLRDLMLEHGYNAWPAKDKRNRDRAVVFGILLEGLAKQACNINVGHRVRYLGTLAA